MIRLSFKGRIFWSCRSQYRYEILHIVACFSHFFNCLSDEISHFLRCVLHNVFQTANGNEQWS